MHRTSMTIWAAALLAAAVGLLASAVANAPWIHVAICLATTGVIVLTALRQNRSAISGGATASVLASLNARFIGYVWCWAALAILIMYGTHVLQWREWPQFVIACALVGGLSLFTASLLHTEPPDAPIARLARGLGAVQMAGMLAAIAGIWLDGKLLRFGREDWGAHNVFVFGAVAIISITVIGYLAERRARTA